MDVSRRRPSAGVPRGLEIVMSEERPNDAHTPTDRLGEMLQAALEVGRSGVRTATRGGRDAVQRYQLEAELEDFWVRLLNFIE